MSMSRLLLSIAVVGFLGTLFSIVVGIPWWVSGAIMFVSLIVYIFHISLDRSGF